MDAVTFRERWRSLTRRQQDAVRLRCEGLQNKEVARQLFVSPQTVKNRLAAVFARMEVNGGSRGAAVCYWLGRYHATTRREGKNR